jgi:hypothetical protein
MTKKDKQLLVLHEKTLAKQIEMRDQIIDKNKLRLNVIAGIQCDFLEYN